MIATLVRAFVVINSSPREGADQVVLRPGNQPILVGVFQAEDERTSVPTGVEPRKKRGAQASNVEESGGTGSKAETNGHDLGV